MYFGLTHGAIVALSKHASKDLQDRYLANLVSGQWTGTMCLTEPHCGTDLGIIRTKAVPAADGSYAINGSKIWITGGDHDMAENIIHLVLAKLPDAPSGSKGISLFLVPKILPDGARNGIWCTGLEHKMGINGSATCFISLEDAKGWLIGEPHQGLSYMFSMMNTARIMVGVQGLGLGETAYQTALSFARERLQGRSLSGVKAPTKEADPILVHPDVRRMLLSQKVMLEGCRALAYWIGVELDVSLHHPDEAQRQIASDRVELLTPVVKAFLTDQGYWSIDQAVQTLGGSGFTKDWGIEQLLRDCRIARIYEGTNGIQALDLVGRKIPMAGGRAVRSLLADIQAFAAECSHEPSRNGLNKALGHLQEAMGWLMMNAMQDREQAGAAATPLLKLFGLVASGYMVIKSAQVAEAMLAGGDTRTRFLEAKLKSRDFFLTEFLSQTKQTLDAVKSGKQHLMAFDEDQF
jgi:alkylation response protein AidB-like acyl-CoA dehydrogenase